MKPVSAFYLMSVLPTLQAVARLYGYALGAHGSIARDLDIVAVPWIEDAEPAEVLAEALRVAVAGHLDNVARRPHGRKSWVIYWDISADEKPYVDLSVMPRLRDT